eukprot:Skav229412  [mRNA]  locus=scaffold2297:94225:94545:- [translate_table: standard]
MAQIYIRGTGEAAVGHRCVERRGEELEVAVAADHRIQSQVDPVATVASEPGRERQLGRTWRPWQGVGTVWEAWEAKWMLVDSILVPQVEKSWLKKLSVWAWQILCS